MRTTFLITLLLLLAQPARARARDREWRFSATAGGSYQTVAGAEASSSALLAGGGLRYAHGLSHIIEIGGEAAVAYGNDLELPGAMIGVQPGTLLTDAYAVTLAADVRLIAGIDFSLAFRRTHPLLGLRAGVTGRVLRDPILVDPVTGGSICPSMTCPAPDNSLDLFPFIGLDIGVERRFGRAFLVGLVAGFTYGGADYTAGQLALEISWAWYSAP